MVPRHILAGLYDSMYDRSGKLVALTLTSHFHMNFTPLLSLSPSPRPDSIVAVTDAVTDFPITFSGTVVVTDTKASCLSPPYPLVRSLPSLSLSESAVSDRKRRRGGSVWCRRLLPIRLRHAARKCRSFRIGSTVSRGPRTRRSSDAPSCSCGVPHRQTLACGGRCARSRSAPVILRDSPLGAGGDGGAQRQRRPAGRASHSEHAGSAGLSPPRGAGWPRRSLGGRRQRLRPGRRWS